MAGTDASESEATSEEGPRLDHSEIQDDRQDDMALDGDEDHGARCGMQSVEHNIAVVEFEKMDTQDKIEWYEQRIQEADMRRETLRQGILISAATIHHRFLAPD